VEERKAKGPLARSWKRQLGRQLGCTLLTFPLHWADSSGTVISYWEQIPVCSGHVCEERFSDSQPQWGIHTFTTQLNLPRGHTGMMPATQACLGIVTEIQPLLPSSEFGQTAQDPVLGVCAGFYCHQSGWHVGSLFSRALFEFPHFRLGWIPFPRRPFLIPGLTGLAYLLPCQWSTEVSQHCKSRLATPCLKDSFLLIRRRPGSTWPDL